MNRTFDIVTATAGSIARLGAGVQRLSEVDRAAKKPEKPLELYDIEACPFCRKVRDALTMLDLDAMIYPCPRGSETYRAVVRELGGQEMFPYLVDPNTGAAMYESDDIIKYLFETYGSGTPVPFFRLSPLNTASSILASAVRPLQGLKKRPSVAPEQPLELFSFEASPFARLVRETLCELEIPYLLRNLGKGAKTDWLGPDLRKRWIPDAGPSTAKRQELFDKAGKVMVPYLIDPNTGVEMFESSDICAYLNDTYGR